MMFAVFASPHRRAAACLLLVVLLAGCSHLFEQPGVGDVVEWDDLPGWRMDHHAEAWPALLATCESAARQTPAWTPVCDAAAALSVPDDASARAFFETWFSPRRIVPMPGQSAGLITGYYEPVLRGSRVRTDKFRYPIYQPPADLLTIDLAALYPELRGRTLRGRLDGNRVVPYFARAEIDSSQPPLVGKELIWLDDPVARFFLQVQGSGRVILENGEELAVGYADQNGHPYVALGRCLVQRGALSLESITLKSIRAWLTEHPEEMMQAMNCNPSYVFFQARAVPRGRGPIGALNVSLTPLRSIAVDPAYIPLGAAVWLDTELPQTDARFRRLVFAQDTGGAIRGSVRADLFCGQGVVAEALAGEMKQPGRLYVLLPRTQHTASR